MAMGNKDFDGLREKLDNLEWPAGYLFKFIVPAGKTEDIIRILPKGDLSTKESGQGKYVSVTSYAELGSSEEVIEVYQKAAGVEGVIAL